MFQVLGSMFDMIISCSRVHLHTDVFGQGFFPSLGLAFQIAMQADRRDKSYLSKSVDYSSSMQWLAVAVRKADECSSRNHAMFGDRS